MTLLHASAVGWTRKALLSAILTAAAIAGAAIESFEDGVGLWSSPDSHVSRSSRHWKLGSHSLRWEAAPGATLIRAPDERLRNALASRNGGVKLWLYCERLLPGELRVQAGAWVFPIKLGFTGWRAVWVQFKDDAVEEAAVDGVCITALQAEGVIFLDAIEFGDVPWFRQGDARFPGINSRRANGAYWMTDQDWAAVDPPPPEGTPSAAERQAFRAIEERYERWMFGRLDDSREPVRQRLRGVEAYTRNGHAAFEKLGLTRREDGVVTGPGAFCGMDRHRPHLAADIFQLIALPLAYDATLNDSAMARYRFLELIDYAHDQGWAAGSLMGSGYGGQLRIASYVHAMYILREWLASERRLERELETLRYHLALGEIYAEPRHPGANADDLRTRFLFRLLYVLMQEDSADKLRDMRCLRRWGESALSIAPGYGGAIKPDGTVFHHATAYASAYGNNALHMSSLVYWLLHDTPFELSARAGLNLKRALMTLRFMGGTYHVPMGVSGRWPFSGAALVGTSPAYAYMADALGDSALGAAYARLWDADAPGFDRFFGSASARIYWSTSPGSLPWLLDQHARYEPEDHPSGHRALPYAAMAVHRRRQWVASVRGWSKYVWNYEASASQNRYGRYSSYGMIQIFGRGDPVNPAASGYREEGWDWLRPPGATVIRVPLADLHESAVIPRSYTEQPFVGGVELNGEDGLWAMVFRDPHYEPTFAFRKSAVFVGETVLCMGSGIRNEDREHPTETIIYQSVLESVPAPLPVEQALTVETLMDPAGNGYFFPGEQALEVRRQHQVSMHNSARHETEGDVAVAWIDHGRAPRHAGYVYAIRPDTTVAALADYAGNPDFEVLQRNAQAHVTAFPNTRTMAYALFEPGDSLVPGPLAGVDGPCLVMTRILEDRLLLAVADPDLRLPPSSPATRYQPGEPSRLTLRLHGAWRLADGSDAVQITDGSILRVDCRDGLTEHVTLIEEKL